MPRAKIGHDHLTQICLSEFDLVVMKADQIRSQVVAVILLPLACDLESPPNSPANILSACERSTSER